ncbi:MAG: DUF4149 domain-containing protein [Candidatus Puniceispirillum sp.]|nr:DUF4149 domain-containing protein [Candidatus Puniceispirillum sp.]MBL6774603.1 DUF4149 domain-containing protein [Candidatus Puniceispirillum sp.]
MQLSILFHAANIGFMVMFTAVVAPTVFKVLSQKAAGAYLRKLFPRLFLFGFITSSSATVAAIFESHAMNIFTSAFIAAGFLGNAFILTPKINQYRDAVLGGDATAKTMFGRLHFISVAVFVLQLLGSGYIVISGYLSG